MDEPKPILNWVLDGDDHVVLTGAVLAGKRVRMQAAWPPWGYSGPERFSVRSARSRLSRGRLTFESFADVDGPPRTHSQDSWLTGKTQRFGQQQRYYFNDAYGNESSNLVVSNVKQWTSEPKISAEAGFAAPTPVGTARFTAEAGRAATKIMIGATADPRVRVAIITSNDESSDSSRMLRSFRDINEIDYSLLIRSRTYWQPAFENGERELILDVDEDHPAEVTIVPQQPYGENYDPFMIAFAVRVEAADDPDQYVISDVVTVEGGNFNVPNVRPQYRPSQVLFRTA